MGTAWTGEGWRKERGDMGGTGAKARVLVVDDHPLLREGIRAMLGRAEGLEWAGDSGDGREALAAMRALQPDLAVVDITLPGGMDGLELIKGMCSEMPSLQVLALSVHDESLYALRAISAGARGYLMKEVLPERLMGALHAVRRGEVVVSEAVSQRLVRRAVGLRESACTDGVQKLSDRELEILAWMGKGASTRQIAQKLCISPKTVETHRVNLKRKLALESAPELLRYALAWQMSQDHRGETPVPASRPESPPDLEEPFL